MAAIFALEVRDDEVKYLLINLLKAYQRYRFRAYPVCRFFPTCSDYAILALNKYTLLTASFKIMGRLLRCQPLWCRVHQVDEP